MTNDEALVERVRHKVRGSTYAVIGEGEAQISKPTVGDIGGSDRVTPARVLREGDKLVVYRCEQTGKLWLRFSDEFVDGRFEALPARDEAVPASGGVEGDLVSRAEVLRIIRRLGDQDADLALYGAEDNARAREYGEAAATRACCAIALMPSHAPMAAREIRAEIIRLMRKEFDPKPPNYSGYSWDDNAEAVADSIIKALASSTPAESAGGGVVAIARFLKERDEALFTGDGFDGTDAERLDSAREITALATNATASPVSAEPVAWEVRPIGDKGWHLTRDGEPRMGYERRPLYASPSPDTGEGAIRAEDVRDALIGSGLIYESSTDGLCYVGLREDVEITPSMIEDIAAAIRARGL